MRKLALTVSLMLATCVAGTASGSKPRIGEACPVGVSLWSMDKMGPDGSWPVEVRVWSEVHSGSEKGEVRITVSPGTEVVEGDLRKIVHPGKGWKGPGDKRWLLRLRRGQDGSVVIRAALSLPGKGSGDHYDYERRMALQVSGTSVVTTDNHVDLAVRTEKGRRFRYGGQFSVALDPDDLDVPVAVEAPPEILSEAVVVVRATNR